MAAIAQIPLNLKLSKETSEQVVRYVSEIGDPSPEAVARFVEDTLSRRLFQIHLNRVRERFSDKTPGQIDDLVEEALTWARSPEGRACK